MLSTATVQPRNFKTNAHILRINTPTSFGTLHLGGAIVDFMAICLRLVVQLVLSD
jgi:hypothetical protein